MKLYRGQIVDTSEDLNGEVWTVAIMNDAEQSAYGECDTSDDYDYFALEYTNEKYNDTEIDFYTDESSLKDDCIKCGNYIFMILEQLV